jgi:hypothetical protein
MDEDLSKFSMSISRRLCKNCSTPKAIWSENFYTPKEKSKLI